MEGLSLLLFVVCFAIHGTGEEIKVNGNNYVTYKISASPTPEENDLLLDFITVHPDGLLVFIGSEDVHEDFLLLDLVQGKLRVTVNLGDNNGGNSEGNLVIDGDWVNNWWHTVKLTLHAQHLTVTIRGKRWNTILPSKNTRLDVHDFVFVGGVNASIYNRLQNYWPTPNFKGCIRDVFFNEEKILVSSKDIDQNYDVHGFPAHICTRARFDVVRFDSPDSYVVLFARNHEYVSVGMRFRTYVAHGVLAHKGYLKGRVFRLILRGGRILLEVQVSLFSELLQLRSGEDLNDGKWHSVSVVLTKGKMKLKVDDLTELVHYNPALEEAKSVNIHDYIFIGGSNMGNFFPLPSLDGCINDLKVNHERVHLLRLLPSEIHGRVSHGCNISSHCYRNPCFNEGKCSQLAGGNFSCNCEGTLHSGPLCRQPAVLATCEEYNQLGLVEDAYCKVDPDGNDTGKPYSVLCNMTGENQAMTVVTHNKQGPQNVGISADVTIGDVYVHLVKYPVELDSIKRLVARSQRCRQLLSFRCLEAKLLQSPTGPTRVSWHGGGGKMRSHHWAGVPNESGKCACGINGTCADPRYFCNCDIGDNVWREDEGYITNKTDLPVTMFQYTGSFGRAYLTVGPLECFGTRRTLPYSTDIKREVTRTIYSVCNVVNPTTKTRVRTPRRGHRERKPKRRIESFRHHHTVTIPATTTGKGSSTERDDPPAIPTVLVNVSDPPPSAYTNASNPKTLVLPKMQVDSGPRMLETFAPTTTEMEEDSIDGNLNVQLGDAGPAGNLSAWFNNTPEDVNIGSSVDAGDSVGSSGREPMMSWQLFVLVFLLVCVVLVFGFVVVLFVKNPEKRALCKAGGLLWVCKKKAKRPDVDGFPEVRLRSRSGELHLSHIGQPIEAGAYNVKSGLITFQTST